jgi:hypothetical protein
VGFNCCLSFLTFLSFVFILCDRGFLVPAIPHVSNLVMLMEANDGWRPRPQGVFLLAVLATTIIRSVDAAVCYKVNGQADPNGSLVPCNPNAAVSMCCSSSDYCLSNGLCLNSGGNNGFSIQGCTDQNWGALCQMRCPVSKAGTFLLFSLGILALPGYPYIFCRRTSPDYWLAAYDGYLYLQMCSGLNGVDNPLCCGDDYTCCSVTASVITTIPLFTALSRPGTAATSPTALTTTMSRSQTNTPPSSTVTSAPTESAGTGGGGLTQSTIVGLGVGIPLGLALIASLVFLGWQLMKRNNTPSKSSPETGFNPPYHPPPGTDPTHASQNYYTSPPAHTESPITELGYTPRAELQGTQIKEVSAVGYRR